MVVRPPEDAPAGPMSVRAFADWAGLHHKTVQRRIDAGALPTSTRKVLGLWMITDGPLALAEWEAHTRPWVGAPASSDPSPLTAELLAERRARRELMELELAKKRGEVVLLRHVEDLWTRHVLQARTRLLALPTHARQRLPHLTAPDLVVLDALIREALEELAVSRIDNKGEP